MEGIRINKFEIEKRVKAVKVKPSRDGLTVIGGDNNQGKTSVLDAIAWALGGDRHRPSHAAREGSAAPPRLHVVMSNGLTVERGGKNGALKVTDPEGGKAGQQLLNEFIGQLALDLPRFMESPGKEKAQTLLKIIGVADRAEALDREEKELYSRRLAIGQIADQKDKYAKEQPYYPDAPEGLVSPSELIRQQQRILARNGENQRKREKAEQYRQSVAFLSREAEAMKAALDKKLRELEEARLGLGTALADAQDLRDQSTAELEENIAGIEETNRKVRANLDKEKAEEDALNYKNQYAALTKEIGDVRQAKLDLLKSARLPLQGLSVRDGELVYKGQEWDNMSGSERLKVSTAIVRSLNPKCGFVLLDKLEQMDLRILEEFGRWLEQEGLQAIATRVSTGEECSIIIEDGCVKGAETPEAETEAQGSPSWKAGVF